MSVPVLRVVALAAVLVCPACASVTGTRTQMLTVTTQDRAGSEVRDADCELANDVGKWHVQTPGSAEVHRSNKDLFVFCRKPGSEDGMATVVSGLKGAIFGNVILGGGVGALIDHASGSAYSYPLAVPVVMGERRQIDTRFEQPPETPP